MSPIYTLETPRLKLRQWLPDDYPVFAEMNSNTNVMRYMIECLGTDASNSLADKCADFISERGWGLWAVELSQSTQFIGFVGLSIPTSPLPFLPCTEIGWRLSDTYWGYGYATEAAMCALDFAFTRLKLEEVVSFTSVHNQPSRNVMHKLGLKNTHNNFLHPSVPANNPLREHVLYTISRKEWLIEQP